MSLAKIFDEVTTALNAASVADGKPKPSHALGEDDLPNPPTIPHVCWVPQGAIIEAPKQAARAPAIQPKEFASRAEIVRVYLFGNKLRDTEDLMERFCRVCRENLTSFSFRATRLDWTNGWPKGIHVTDQMGPGTLCLLEVRFQIPMTFTPLTVIKPQTITVDGTITQPTP